MTEASKEPADDTIIAPDHIPEEDAKENKKRAVRELVLVGVVLF